MTQYKQTEDHIYKFESPFDFIDFLGEPLPGLTAGSESPWETRFTGVKNYAEAKKVSFEGFDVSNVIATLAELEQVFESQDIGVQHDVQGAFVDVGAYMTGEPECMMDFVETERPNSSLKLVFNVSENGGVTTQQIMNRASCLAGVVDYLEKQGVPTEVYCLDATYYGGRPTGVFIKVKESGERLNINLLTGVLHPAFFRRILFNFTEKVYHERAIKGDYGSAVTGEDVVNKLLEKAGFEDVENIIKADTVSKLGGFDTFESIKENAEKMINQINLKLNI